MIRVYCKLCHSSFLAAGHNNGPLLCPTCQPVAQPKPESPKPKPKRKRKGH